MCIGFLKQTKNQELQRHIPETISVKNTKYWFNSKWLVFLASGPCDKWERLILRLIVTYYLSAVIVIFLLFSPISPFKKNKLPPRSSATDSYVSIHSGWHALHNGTAASFYRISFSLRSTTPSGGKIWSIHTIVERNCSIQKQKRYIYIYIWFLITAKANLHGSVDLVNKKIY